MERRVVKLAVIGGGSTYGRETTGFGRLAKALRTVPVVLGIAARVRELAPRAWIVDFTDPVGVATHVGLNHPAWQIGVRSDGEDALPGLLGEHLERVAEKLTDRMIDACRDFLAWA